MKTIAIIQARSHSTRLPHKVLKKFSNGFNTLDFVLHNIAKIEKLDEIYIATTNKKADDDIESYCKNRAKIYRGSEPDVLSRFIEIADIADAGTIIRICADNPFVLREGIEYLLKYHDANYDYSSFALETIPAMQLPIGLFTEVVQSTTLKKLHQDANKIEKEHVTFAIYNRQNSPFFCNFIEVEQFNTKLADKNLRLTLDTNLDFEILDGIISALNLGLDINLSTFEKIYYYIYEHKIIKKMLHESALTKNLKSYDTVKSQS